MVGALAVEHGERVDGAVGVAVGADRFGGDHRGAPQFVPVLAAEDGRLQFDGVGFEVAVVVLVGVVP